MESFDMVMMNTRLPPRKRLLAGFLRENSCCEFLPPVPVISGELGARIREVMNLPNSSLDEIIEVAESVALAAAEIAATARRKAMEKAAMAAKARAAAMTALELLESVSPRRRPMEGYRARTKFRKKQVPIKLFYKTIRRAGSEETDEELARRLHHAMNSSPRIWSNKGKELDKFEAEVVSDSDALCSRNSRDFLSESTLVASEELDKLDEKIVVCSKAEIFMEDDEESGYRRGRKNDVSKDRVAVSSRKGKIRRKKRPLSHFNVVDQLETEVSFGCSDPLAYEELNRECAERCVPIKEMLSPIDGDKTKKTSSVWKCKKLKMSQCSSDNNCLSALC